MEQLSLPVVPLVEKMSAASPVQRADGPAAAAVGARPAGGVADGRSGCRRLLRRGANGHAGRQRLPGG